jgi:uncharacterized protein
LGDYRLDYRLLDYRLPTIFLSDNVRVPLRQPAIAACLVLTLTITFAAERPSPVSPIDDTDRTTFQSWFTFLADAQFERPSPDVVDCASLVRHAYREALRPHSPAWYRSSQLPAVVSFPDVRHAPPMRDGAWLLFRTATNPDRFAEFADAETIVRLNTRFLGREIRAAQPGDLLYFRHEDAESPSHLMVLVGPSRFDPSRHDWIVYHTGPQGSSPGEVRKVSLVDLERHPSPRWRPVALNASFIGIYRLSLLDREHR